MALHSIRNFPPSPSRGRVWTRGFLSLGSAVLLTAATASPASGAESTGTAGTAGTEGTEGADPELLLLMDASASMTEEDAGGTVRIEAAREALHSVVDGLDDDLDVGLRVFSSDITDGEDDAACSDSRLAVDLADDNRDELREAIDGYDAVGARTPIFHALEEAAGDLGDEGKRTIVLVSDGEENCVPDPCQAAERISDQGVDVSIHSVGYNVSDEARQQLRCISDTTNGNYYDAEDVDSLSNTLQRLSMRAFQPFQFEGESVTGSADVDTAPTVESGQYVDHWSEEPLFYRIPVSESASSVHVGVSAIHLDSAGNDPLAFGLGTDDTETWTTYPGNAYVTNTSMCVQNNLHEGTGAGTQTVRSNQVTVNREDAGPRGEGCETADELILMVEAPPRTSGNSYAGQPFEFVVVEEDEVTNLDELPEGAGGSIADYQWEDMGGQGTGGQGADDREAEELLGGNSFNNAEPVEPGGTYSSEIMSGESLLYRVPVEWGETLQAELSVGPESDWAQDDGPHGRGMSMQFYSLHRGQVENPTTAEGQDHGRRGLTTATETAYWQNKAHPVRWKNREEASGASGMRYASVAGDYYILVNLAETSRGQDTPTPFKLTVDTYGEVEGVPEYAGTGGVDGTGVADGSEVAGDSEGTEDTEDAENTAAEESGLQPVHWIGMGLVGVVLIAGLGFVFIRVVRKR